MKFITHLLFLFIFISCENSAKQENLQLNYIIKSIISDEANHGNKLPNNIRDEIKSLWVYSETKDDTLETIRQLPNVRIGEIVKYKSKNFRTDSLTLLNQNEYPIKIFKIDKSINPKLILFKKEINSPRFSISNPVYFEQNNMAYIQLIKTDSLGYSEAESYILQNENGIWRVIKAHKLWRN